MAINASSGLGSISAQRFLQQTNRQLQGTFSRLSSGLRIATAADDAAGLAISEKMRANLRSLQQAQRNANDAISLTSTADGALNEVGSMLGRMRELAIQSMNGTLGTSERAALQQEFSSLSQEVGRVAGTTNFNGVNLLNQTASVTFQVGTGTGGTDQIAVQTANATVTALGLAGAGVDTAANASAAVGAIDGAISQVNAARGRFGATANRMTTTISTIGSSIESTAAAESRIRDADFAVEAALLTQLQVRQSAGIATLMQANTQSKSALRLLQ